MSLEHRAAVYNFTQTTHIDTYAAISKSDHRGRTILIIGASKGIGRATAISLSKAGAANIIIAARSRLDDVEQEILSAAPTSSSAPLVLKLNLDVTSESSIRDAVEVVKTQFGSLDILVNSAGYLENWIPIAESNPVDWWMSWEINIKGVYLVTRAFLTLLLKSNEKTLVNIGSLGAHTVTSGSSAYKTTKMALLRLTEFVAIEYAKEGLVVFAVHPGAVPTDLSLRMPESTHSILVDKPELAGDSIAWLTQDRKDWLSGRYISVNWDMPELISRRDEIVQGDKLKFRIVL